MKKMFATLLMTAVIAAAGGCGHEAATQTEGASEVTAMEETVEAGVTETETEEMGEMPCAEEQGWVFSDLSGFSAGTTALKADCERNYEEVDDPEFIVDASDAEYEILSATKGRPDDSGRIVYTFKYQKKYMLSAEKPEGNTNYVPGVGSPDFSVVDYYSGIVVPSRTMTTDTNGGDEVESEVEIEYEGNTYVLGRTKVCSSNSDVISDWKTTGNGKKKYEAEVTQMVRMEISAPEDFDGVVLVISYQNEPEDEQKDHRGEEVDEAAYRFGDDGENVNDYRFIRISDYATEAE